MKIKYLAFGLALVCGFALAQTEADSTQDDSAKPPHRAHLQNKLGLTDEQAQQMREIRDSGGSMEEMRAVLTPEQQAKAATLRKDNKADRGERKAQMQKSLGLSDEQMEKMAEIRKAGGSREEMSKVLTPQQQAKLDTIHSQKAAKKSSPDADQED
jgi:Spy/CpxP family protein refolding chaperone